MNLKPLLLLVIPILGCSLIKDVIEAIPSPRARVTSTVAPTSVASPSQTPTLAPPTSSPTAIPSKPPLSPPPMCLINGGMGWHQHWPQKKQILVDTTPWWYMGEEWRLKYACGPNGHPCWGGGDCSPCDPDHAPAFNGPCQNREWGSAEGARFKVSGPGVVSWQKNPENKMQVYIIYNPGLWINFSACAPIDNIDLETGLVIPNKFRKGSPPNGTDDEGCRNVGFLAPA
jgi:hypothetical protein